MFSKPIHLAFPSAFKSLTVLIVENLSNTAERIKAFGAMRYETQFFLLIHCYGSGQSSSLRSYRGLYFTFTFLLVGGGIRGREERKL